MTHDATPEAEQRRPEALADPEMEEYQQLLVRLGLDEAEAQRIAKLDIELERLYFSNEDATTRRRKRVAMIRRDWFGEPDEAAAPAPGEIPLGEGAP